MPEFNARFPQFRERIRERLQRQFFMHHLGVELTRIEAGEVTAEVRMKDELQQQNGFLHGGVTATLCDVSAGFAAFTLVGEDELVVTGDLRVSYLNPGTADRYEAKGWVIKTGSMLHFCEAEVWGHREGQDPVMIAKASATMVTVKESLVSKRS